MNKMCIGLLLLLSIRYAETEYGDCSLVLLWAE